MVLRIIYYLILLVMCIFLSPCLIYSILKKRRNRLRLHEFIREERIRNGGSFALLNRYNQNEVNNRQHEDQVILLEESKEFQPIQNEFEFPRNSFNEILLNLLRGHQLIERNEGTFEGLKRIKYEEALKKLDYEEWTIWMDSFKTETDEDLIYLPCNTKHIFHSTWILEWLRRDPNWPLWKSPVNKDAINMYG